MILYLLPEKVHLLPKKLLFWDSLQINFKLRFYLQWQVTFSMLKISASIADVQFEAKVRVILKPLVGLIPIVGGVQESDIFLYSSRMIMNSWIYDRLSIVLLCGYIKCRKIEWIPTQVYFLQEPHLDFDLGGAASILDMPGLNGLLKDAIQQQVNNHWINLNRAGIVGRLPCQN